MSESIKRQPEHELRKETARSLAMGGMDDVHVVSRETARHLLTPRREEIIDTLKEHDPSSVRELARLLNRDKGAVSRDLGELAEHNIVTYEKEGRSKRPVLTQEHIVAAIV